MSNYTPNPGPSGVNRPPGVKFCSTCNVSIKEKFWARHERSQKHKDKSVEYIVGMSNYTPAPGPSGLNRSSQNDSINRPSQDESKKYVARYKFCDACNGSFSASQFKRHISSKTHKDNVAEKNKQIPQFEHAGFDPRVEARPPISEDSKSDASLNEEKKRHNLTALAPMRPVRFMDYNYGRNNRRVTPLDSEINAYIQRKPTRPHRVDSYATRKIPPTPLSRPSIESPVPSSVRDYYNMPPVLTPLPRTPNESPVPSSVRDYYNVPRVLTPLPRTPKVSPVLSPIPSTTADEQDEVAKFDDEALSRPVDPKALADCITELEQPLFSAPVRKVHDDAERILAVLGPNPFLDRGTTENRPPGVKFCSTRNVSIKERSKKHKGKPVERNEHQDRRPTVKDLKALAKQYNIRSVNRLTKDKLVEVIDKIKNVFFKEDDLKKLTIKQLRKLAKEHSIHLQTRFRKSEVIDAFLKPQSQILRDSFLNEMKFDDDLFTGPREERTTPFTIEQMSSRHIRKYSTTELTYRIHLERAMEVENAIFGMFQQATRSGNYRPGDRVYIVAQHPEFHHDISVALDTNGRAGIISRDHVRNFVDQLQNIIDSNTAIDISRITFHIRIINVPRGAGGTKILNLRESKHTKQCITQIKNTDKLCGPRAIITALTYNTSTILGRNLTPNEIKYVRMGRSIQTSLAKELCEKLEYYNEEGFTLDDIRNVEELLGIQIKVVCAENFNTVIYEGSENETKVYLYKNGNHFDAINSLTGFFGSSYYCHVCDTPYQNKGAHTCKKTKKKTVCTLCLQKQHDLKEKSKIYCRMCNRYCYNQKCAENHIQVCETVYKCLNCNKICQRTEDHKCGFGKCRNCNQTFETIADHKCHMVHKKQKGGFCLEKPCVCNGQSEKKSKGCTYTEKYIFFDYEANQESGVHEANLVVAWNYSDGTKHVFRTNDEFCKWLISKEHAGFTAIAHYAKGYDSHFILKYCVENTLKPYTIYSGSKLMFMNINRMIRVIDSSNFVASPLSAFPRTFGLKEMKKGYFPHYFNTSKNQNYVGPIPDIKFYGDRGMKPEERKTFLEWHEQRVKENYVFDFQKELHEYCESDVDILGRGCLELRKEFLDIANIDPFQYLTIASVCMAIYRSKYLKDNTIASIKEDRKENFSIGSITWLRGFPNVQHALNGGEVTICGAKVDGFDKSTNTVYQYHGCFWHGCPKCFHEDTINNVRQENMGDLYERTVERCKQITDSGYRLVEMWECQWVKSKSYKTVVKKSRDIVVEPLRPRDAFYGGRTNAAKLKVQNKKLKYIDVCSLYPTVQYFDYYPVGHPEKILNPETYDPNWYGLIKCKVLAPKKLYHPVLPIKDEKLLFVLCRKCFEEKCDDCEHTEDERCLIGTWTTDELSKALEKGYEVKEIYEVWHFKQKSKDLFQGYVKDFMKIKLETSPWEDDFATVEDYILAVKQCLDIELLPENIIPNPGKRAVAKICLNSLWGKFGQRLNMSQTEYVTETKRWYELLLDDRLEIGSCIFVNENIVQVTYKFLNQYVEDSFSTNLFIAAFTTSNARLRLYHMLDRLIDRVVYYDTDSIVYIEDGTCNVETGCMLGEWTDELGKNNHITEWVSTGPKSYSYLMNNGKGVTKVKGFTLNHENSQLLNRKTMQELIENNLEQKIKLTYNMITRCKKTKTLVNRIMEKDFKFEYDKRYIMKRNTDNDVIDTLPWGY